MMGAGAAHYDLSRWGMEIFRASPRQADLMIVAGRVSQKMAPVLRQVYDQMVEPKWVISMGVCASSGGMFNNYAIVQGVDQVVPVDVYVPGCPPGPETLMHGILTLHTRSRTARSSSAGPRRAAEGRRSRSTSATASRPRSEGTSTEMADDDATAREEDHEVDAGTEVPSDEVAAAVLERFPDGVFADSHGQAVVYVPRAEWHDVAAFLRDEQQFTQCVDVDRCRPTGRTGACRAGRRRRRALRSGRQLPVARSQSAHPPDRAGAGRRPHGRVAHRPLSGGQLRRARDLRPLRHRVHRPPRSRPHPHARRLDRSPAAQGRRSRGVPVTFKGDPSPR